MIVVRFYCTWHELLSLQGGILCFFLPGEQILKRNSFLIVITGARKGKIELFPLVAMGIGLAFIGTIVVIFVAMLLRSRFASSHRGSSTLGSSHCEKPNSMMLSGGMTTAPNNSSTSGSANNTSTTNNSSRIVGGYRPVPQSKTEADANPDIIPDGNSFSTGNHRYKKYLMEHLYSLILSRA